MGFTWYSLIGLLSQWNPDDCLWKCLFWYDSKDVLQKSDLAKNISILLNPSNLNLQCLLETQPKHSKMAILNLIEKRNLPKKDFASKLYHLTKDKDLIDFCRRNRSVENIRNHQAEEQDFSAFVELKEVEPDLKKRRTGLVEGEEDESISLSLSENNLEFLQDMDSDILVSLRDHLLSNTSSLSDEHISALCNSDVSRKIASTLKDCPDEAILLLFQLCGSGVSLKVGSKAYGNLLREILLPRIESLTKPLNRVLFSTISHCLKANTKTCVECLMIPMCSIESVNSFQCEIISRSFTEMDETSINHFANMLWNQVIISFLSIHFLNLL